MTYPSEAGFQTGCNRSITTVIDRSASWPPSGPTNCKRGNQGQRLSG
jgi:hypothetical protein